MNNQKGLEQYRKQSILTARPQELVLMLYDHCLKHLVLARTDMENHQVLQARNHLIKAQDIVTELIHGLDFKYALSEQLYQLYEYINHELMMANVDQDKTRLDLIEPLLRELRETWQQATRSLSHEGSGEWSSHSTH